MLNWTCKQGTGSFISCKSTSFFAWINLCKSPVTSLLQNVEESQGVVTECFRWQFLGRGFSWLLRFAVDDKIKAWRTLWNFKYGIEMAILEMGALEAEKTSVDSSSGRGRCEIGVKLRVAPKPG